MKPCDFDEKGRPRQEATQHKLDTATVTPATEPRNPTAELARLQAQRIALQKQLQHDLFSLCGELRRNRKRGCA